jgi:citrate lyase subunit alpha/citrate CoA-transferase
MNGNANGFSGKSRCGSLGYARVDAEAAGCVVLLTEEWVDYPNYPASIAQDRVDLIVQVDEVGDPAKITAGAIRLTSNPRELLIARQAAKVIEHSGYFKDGFSLQTGTGGASLAVTRSSKIRCVVTTLPPALVWAGSPARWSICTKRA